MLETPPATGNSGRIFLFDSRLLKFHPESFQNQDEKILFLTDREIFGEIDRRQSESTRKVSLEFLANLSVGDFIVHIDHGIGRFEGIQQKEFDGVIREYLYIQYALEDKLFVPVDQADRVSKYLGAGEEDPQLNRLGSIEWTNIKRKVRKETKELAKDLLNLYAKRSTADGLEMQSESRWDTEFAEKFPYEETPDQLKTISDVYADMASDKPMDRLVCGDVGFGKTEIAMRAAFRAVMNGKQVAVLTPITILADQHYRSFLKRMEGFPVRIGILSRFQSKAEQTITIDKAARGEIDIVVGTHRLLSDDIKFKQLGLLVVDEEQRFGVKQKEKLKKKKLEMDVLTLTATPIPRTLNMSLNGLRDISTITTPPPGRLPIITEVRKFSWSLIREAVLREKERSGQIYILHNRVETIETFAEKIRQMVPEASFVVAHGQLREDLLESRIIDFKEGKYDCLISSTIIENGIDLANANTLIVDKAENFGLSQLYQLRGRVGRGKKQAYSYFLYHAQKLALDAKKRLKAVMEATDLGAGFQIAMRDLEIRGAGNLLGADQSGTMKVIGVAHFTRMLNQAVEDMKNGKLLKYDDPVEVNIDLPVSGYLPDTYVTDNSQKILIYQKLSSADNVEQLRRAWNELVDVYGKPPREVQNLLEILELKIFARAAGILAVKVMDKSEENFQLMMQLSDDVTPLEISRLLNFCDRWEISGDKMRITRDELGGRWLYELKEGVRMMREKKKKKKNGE